MNTIVNLLGTLSGAGSEIALQRVLESIEFVIPENDRTLRCRRLVSEFVNNWFISRNPRNVGDYRTLAREIFSNAQGVALNDNACAQIWIESSINVLIFAYYAFAQYGHNTEDMALCAWEIAENYEISLNSLELNLSRKKEELFVREVIRWISIGLDKDKEYIINKFSSLNMRRKEGLREVFEKGNQMIIYEFLQESSAISFEYLSSIGDRSTRDLSIGNRAPIPSTIKKAEINFENTTFNKYDPGYDLDHHYHIIHAKALIIDNRISEAINAWNCAIYLFPAYTYRMEKIEIYRDKYKRSEISTNAICKEIEYLLELYSYDAKVKSKLEELRTYFR